MYLTYEEYQNMGGTLDETTFNDYEFGAECIINWYTFNRLLTETEIPVQVAKCANALIKLIKLKADAMMLGAQTITTTEGGVTKTVTTSASIASQSNDGVSISYNTISATNILDLLSPFKQGGEVETTVRLYLNGVMNSVGKKLLYRGIYPDE